MNKYVDTLCLVIYVAMVLLILTWAGADWEGVYKQLINLRYVCSSLAQRPDVLVARFCGVDVRQITGKTLDFTDPDLERRLFLKDESGKQSHVEVFAK